jgi:transcriptional regulator with XRE-family HTH domain
MEVVDKINHILKQKKLTKREFAKILRDLEPRLKSTDQPPIETTIYKYLNGQVSIPIELVSFIAEALDITEQELFDDSLQTKIKFLKHILKDSSPKELDLLQKSVKLNLTNIEIDKENTNDKNKKIMQLVDLLIFAPEPFLDKIIARLKDIKNQCDI